MHFSRVCVLLVNLFTAPAGQPFRTEKCTLKQKMNQKIKFLSSNVSILIETQMCVRDVGSITAVSYTHLTLPTTCGV